MRVLLDQKIKRVVIFLMFPLWIVHTMSGTSMQKYLVPNALQLGPTYKQKVYFLQF